MVQQLMNPRNIQRMQVPSLALLSRLRIRRCPELWCRSQTWLRSCVAVAVAVAGSHSSNSTPNLGTSICHGGGPKKTKKKLSTVRPSDTRLSTLGTLSY